MIKMKIRLKRWLALCLTLALSLLSACACGESSGLFYLIQGGRSTLTILGSIHVGSEEMYPLAPAILNTLQDADYVVFECDTESSEALSQTMQRMAYGLNDGLKKHVSPEVYAMVEQVAKKTGYPMSVLSTLKPWAIVSMLTMDTTAAAMGVEDLTEAASYGVEEQISLLTGDKPRLWLEETSQQLDALDGMSDALQSYLLETACQSILDPSSISGTDADTAKWPEWWAQGNGLAFADSYQKGLEQETEPELAEEYHQRLVSQRNQRMAQRLQEMLEGDASCFAVIGLMHLVLPGDSVLSLLEEMGYTVTQIAF